MKILNSEPLPEGYDYYGVGVFKGERKFLSFLTNVVARNEEHAITIALQYHGSRYKRKDLRARHIGIKGYAASFPREMVHQQERK